MRLVSRLAIVGIAATCLSCVYAPPPPPPPPAVSARPPAQAAGQYCREFTAPIAVGGQTVQADGIACQQPDGTWKITQETPGQPQPQVFVAPPPPADYYAYPYPWWAPVEIGIGGTFIFGGGRGDHGHWRSGWHRR